MAAVSGLAIAVSGISIGSGAAGASASPTDPGDQGGPPPAVTAPAAVGPAGEHTVTLITGDLVTVTDLADGTHAVSVETVHPGAGFQTLEIEGEVHVLPQEVMPYLTAGLLDRDLFNVSRLIDYGYDDASVDATPVILELDGGATARGATVPAGIDVGTALDSIDGAAATADHASAASTWDALTASTERRRSGAGTTPASFGGGIAAIHLDGKVQATLDSSVPFIGAPTAWAAGYTGEGVTVAVLDTGYDDTHPDLAGHVLAASTSFVPGEDVADDPHGHGTHVASTIAGTGAASDGVQRGVADGADLLVGKVLDAAGSGQDSWIIAAMQWAGQNAPIVSMSLGSPQPSDGTDLMATALDTISAETGALFVVAAGNSASPETIGSPGSAAAALTVGSVDDPSGDLSYFSSQGPLTGSGALKPELVGPGSDVTAARSADSPGEGSYVSMSGTSMATPHVAGAAAIVKQQHPDYTGAQLRSALTSTAKDVGLTSYEAGSGVVDVAAAVEDDVVASGSGDFGMLTWNEAVEPVVRTVDYTNRGDADVVLALDATLGTDVLTSDVSELAVPAGGTRSVTLTADPAKVPFGSQLSGALVASVDGAPVARTALGIIAEAERYDLTVTATDFAGAPLATYGWLWNVETASAESFAVDGETTLRLPGGTYSVMSVMDVARTPDTEALVLVGDPLVTLDRAASVALDARTATQVTVDVGDDDLEPVVRRMDFSMDGFAGSAMAPVWTDELWAEPMTAPQDSDFGFTTRWRLQAPTLALAAGRHRLDLIPQVGSSLLDGKIRARAVDVGTGSAEELAAADVRGKIAVATRSDDVPAPVRSANAVAAGAALLLTVNDADGELSEWVGSADFESDTSIPVAAVSGVQGRALLASMAGDRVTLSGEGTPVVDETYDVVRYSKGSVPRKLDYRPRRLAKVDTTYYGDGGQVGEFRYDFVPGTEYGVGYPMRAERGLERTEWVSTDQVEWYQTATAVDPEWQIRDVQRSYRPGQRVEAGYFGPIVRPYVGPGYWAPNRQGDFGQVNLPSWADGDSPERTGSLDSYSDAGGRTMSTQVYVDGELAASSPYQSTNVSDLPDGTSDWRVVSSTTHDGSFLESSSSVTTEWTFSSTGSADVYTGQMLPMMQAFYDVDLDASGSVGEGRRKGRPVELGLELSHLLGATGSAALTGATLEARSTGGTWTPVHLRMTSADTEGGPPAEGGLLFAEGRDFLTTYAAKVAVPDAGAWIDLRVTGTDAAGGTFSQEIERAFEAAPAQRGHGGGHGGGH